MPVTEEELNAIIAGTYNAPKVAKPAPSGSSPRPQPKPTGIIAGNPVGRVVVGALEDAANGFIGAVEDVDRGIDQWSYDTFGVGTTLATGRDASNGVIELITRDEWERRQAAAKPTKGPNLRVDRVPEVARGTGTAENVVRDIAAFGFSFAGGQKLLQGVSTAGRVAAFTKPVISGTLATFASERPEEGNLANLAQSLGVPPNVVLEALDVDEDDSGLEARLKNAVADGAVVGVVTDAAILGLAKAVRAMRPVVQARRAAQAIAEVPDEALAIPPKADPTAPVDPTAPAPKAMAEDVGLGSDPKLVAPEVDPVDTLVSSIPARVARLTDDETRALAQEITKDVDRTLEFRIGFDPQRIDWAKTVEGGQEGVDKVIRLVKAVGEGADGIARSAGSEPQSWGETAKIAAALGGRGFRIVGELADATESLAGKAWAARRVLSGSARQLLDKAEAAKAFAHDPASAEWQAFEAALNAHATLQGTFRGSVSEVARALNAQKAMVKARSPVDVAKRLAKITGGAGDDASRAAVAKDQADLLERLSRAKTPAQRQALIEAIQNAGGDLGSLGRAVDEMSVYNRVQRAGREYLTANLFSPGTGAANFFGGLTHIGMDYLSRLAVNPLQALIHGGASRQVVAARVANHAYAATFLPSLAAGFSRALRLVRADLANEADIVAVGLPKSARKATAYLRETYGEAPQNFLRNDFIKDRAFRISNETLDAWADNADHGPAFFRAGMRTVAGIIATPINALGAAARMNRVLWIDAFDEMMGTVTFRAQQASEAARVAALEAVDAGKSGKELAAYVKARSAALVKSTSAEQVARLERLVALGAKEDSEEVARLAAEAAVSLKVEKAAAGHARKMLFQDDLKWGVNKRAASWVEEVNEHTMGVIFPFFRTPMRIFETVWGEYTPIGSAIRLTQKDLWRKLHTEEAQIIVAQGTLGTLAAGAAFTLAQSGQLVANDGGWRSSNRLQRDSYSFELFGKRVEYNRLDPLGALLGFGADLAEYLRENDLRDLEDQDHSAVSAAVRASLVAFTRNALSKTWLTSMQDLMEVVGSMDDPKQFDAALEKLTTNQLGKIPPAAGTVRWWEGEDTGVLREASTMWEKVLTATPWASELPAKRDELLGREITYDRVLGLKAKDVDDPLLAELGDLAFDLPRDGRTKEGVRLTSEQTSRFRELTGQIVRDETGRTLEETLRAAVASDAWQYATRAEKLEFIRGKVSTYRRLAKGALKLEDPQFRFDTAATKVRTKMRAAGATEPEVDARIQELRDFLTAVE